MGGWPHPHAATAAMPKSRLKEAAKFDSKGRIGANWKRQQNDLKKQESSGREVPH